MKVKAVSSFFVSTSSGLTKVKLALALFALVSAVGCGSGEGASDTRPSAAAPAPEKAQALPELQVTEDEVMLDGPQALIGGTVENTSGVRLENVVLEMELSGRDGGSEVRQVPLKPESLSPGEAGQYTLSVSNHDWSRSKLLRIRSSSRADELAFVSRPGAKRPPERVKPDTKVVVQKPPRPKGEEFINTPDSAEPIP